MIVLDTSAAVDMARRTPEAMDLRELMTQGEKVISCDLMRAEAANVTRRFVRAGKLRPEVAEEYYEKILDLVDEFYPIEELQDEALRESIRFQHPTYDLFYFVLARRTGATLFTLDRKLMRLADEHGVNCVVEIDFPTGDDDGEAQAAA